MKKRIISVMAVLAMLCGPTMMLKAQHIFNSDEEMEKSLRGTSGVIENDLTSVTAQDDVISMDNYAPLGGGILVLGCLGGAYLVGKRRKE
ncbi:MAG: hypothetical protein IKX35_01035 [Bacteroidales bacterium]|nr:hypothetical protein [Bacteroidales bacterium]